MASPIQTDPYQRGSPLARSFLPLTLITLGFVFLLSNLVPERGRGGLIVLGLGAAFLIGRITTGRYGYAVPAGILIAIGSYISLQDVTVARSLQSGGLFFVLLGLGFALVYVVGARPSAVWPLFPATILVGLGLVLFGAASLAPLASASWIVSYWPAALVLLGLWLLLRDQIPLPLRRPIATLGGVALLGYGVLAAAATVAAGGASARTGFWEFGAPPFTETVTLDAPLSSEQTFTVNNPTGRTTIHAGSSPNVHVVATKHRGFGGQTPEVRLTPDSSGVTLDTPSSIDRIHFGGSSWVEYIVEVPSTASVRTQTGSGSLDIDGVSGPVQADTSSGRLSLSNLSGAVQARTASGSVDLTNIAGELRVNTTSGSIHGTQLRHVREAIAASGSIQLDGAFTDGAQVRTTSGSVNVKLLPGSAVQVNAHTGSGRVTTQGISTPSGVTQANQFTATIGTPSSADAILSIETTSGSIRLSQ